MNKLTMITTAALAAAVTLSLATGAFALPPPRPHLPHSHDLSCTVRGPNLIITNFGDTNADSGRQLVWSAPNTNDGGTLTLPKMLAPGEEVLIADVLTDFALPGDTCDAAFV
jgi:hypothetical protein